MGGQRGAEALRLVGGLARWLLFEVVTTENKFDINVDKLLPKHGVA
jgi:hypothetical protein